MTRALGLGVVLLLVLGVVIAWAALRVWLEVAPTLAGVLP